MAAARIIIEVGGWSFLSLLDGPSQPLVGWEGPSLFYQCSSKGFFASEITKANIGNLSFSGQGRGLPGHF